MPHGAFIKVDHIPGHQISLNKFSKLKSLNMFSDHNRIKSEINNIPRKSPNILKLNTILPITSGPKKNSTRKIRKYFQLGISSRALSYSIMTMVMTIYFILEKYKDSRC